MIRVSRTQHGFMLAAIVLVLLSIAFVVLAVRAGTIIAARGDTISKREGTLMRIQESLVQYASVYRRLPCPANPSLNATSVLAGYPNGNSTVPTPAATSIICSYHNGVVPWKALGLTLNDVTDEWGRLISYRVYDGQYGLTQAGGASAVDCDTNNLTTPNIAPTAAGLCNTQNSSTHDTLRSDFIAYSGTFSFVKGVTVNDFGQVVPNVAFVLISHGPSGLGGYLPSGAQTLPLPAVGAMDYVNTQTNPSAFWRNAPSAPDIAPGAVGHYDDVVRYLSIADLLRLARLDARDWPESVATFSLQTTSNMTLPSNDPLNPHFLSSGASGSGQEFTQTTASGQIGVTSGGAAGSYSTCLWWPRTVTVFSNPQRYALNAYFQFAASNTTGDTLPGFVMGFLSGTDVAGVPTNGSCGTSLIGTTAATGLAGQNVITVASTTGMTQGLSVFGSGIPFNATISGIAGLDVTLSQSLTSDLSLSTINFADSRRIRRDLGWAGGSLASYTDRFGVEFDAVADTGSGGPPVVPTANDPSRPHLAADYGGVVHGTDAASCAMIGSGLGCDSEIADFSSVSQTATGTSGESTINVTSIAGIIHGMSVSGTGIGAGATVTGLSGNDIILSVANTSDVAGTINFAAISTRSFMQNGLNVFHNFRVEVYPRDCVATTGTGASTPPPATQIAVASATGIAAGMAAYGEGIGIGATVVSVDGPTGIVTLSVPNSGTVSGTITFGERPEPLTTATGAKFQSTITVAKASGIAVGMTVSGTGIGIGVAVVSVDGATGVVTLSVPNFAAVSGSINFSKTISRTLVKAWTLSNAGCNENPILCATLKDIGSKFTFRPSTTATGVAGQSTIVVAYSTGIATGMAVSGTGIGNGATVISVDETTGVVTLSVVNSSTVSGAISFEAIYGNRQILYAVSCVPQSVSTGAYDSLNLGITTATRTRAAAVTTTATGLTGGATIIVASATGITAGMSVRGTGIGNAATVVSVDGTTGLVTLSVPNQLDVAGTISFGGGPNVIFQGLNVITRSLP